MREATRKPPWLRVRAPGGEAYHRLRRTLRGLALHTVCEQARCPNIGTCWREGTATVMLLGPTCSRGCRFCAVAAGDPAGVVERDEPGRVAAAVGELGLEYVVLTMVTRDDLTDGGAAVVAATVERLRALVPKLRIETLVSDFAGDGDALDSVIAARPDVLGHNVEVVREWTPRLRDGRASYERSLALLARAKERAPGLLTKSSLMVGVGETDAQVMAALRDLRAVGVDIVTIGQYLRPTPQHHPVDRFVTPATFAAFRDAALALGFGCVASAPLVRSSFRAGEWFVASGRSGPAPSAAAPTGLPPGPSPCRQAEREAGAGSTGPRVTGPEG